MKHFRTTDFLEAIRELLRPHSLQYAEDCAWSALRYKLIDIDDIGVIHDRRISALDMTDLSDTDSESESEEE